jgi:hypothetical protein
MAGYISGLTLNEIVLLYILHLGLWALEKSLAGYEILS